MRYFFLLSLSLLVTACQDAPEPTEDAADQQYEDSMNLIMQWAADSALLERVREGETPADWSVLPLGRDMRIAFPREPETLEDSLSNREAYRLRWWKFTYFASALELENDSLYQQQKRELIPYYDAILDDLAQSTGASVTEREPFLFMNVYKSMKARLEGDNMVMYVRLIGMGDWLYNLAFLSQTRHSNRVERKGKAFLETLDKEVYQPQ